MRGGVTKTFPSQGSSMRGGRDVLRQEKRSHKNKRKEGSVPWERQPSCAGSSAVVAAAAGVREGGRQRRRPGPGGGRRAGARVHSFLEGREKGGGPWHI
jgi:hypothetical protein